MLSRIAESLMWIGRYVERADDTARILEVHIHMLVEDPWADEPAMCQQLLAIMGIDPPAGPSVDRDRVIRLLVDDLDNPSSIVGSLSAARQNARGAREIVSSEMWETLNATWIALPEARRRARQLGMHTFFQWVRERTAIVTGVADSTMSRDDCWNFLVLGRSLERIDMTARLITTQSLTDRDQTPWMMLLRSCGAYETFLRTYRGAVGEDNAAEFLLLDRLFPRSIFCALSMAETCLAELDPSSDRAGVGDEARRLLGRARLGLEFRGARDLLTDLPAQMDSLQRTCTAVSEAVAQRYFPAARMTAWALEH